MSNLRLDFVRIDGPIILENGFLKADAFITRAGVFEYWAMDGSVVRELRHPDDVFDPESLDTIKSLVVTNNHPPVLLDSSNAKIYFVGYTTENIKIENEKIGCGITVIDSKTIQEVMEEEKKEMSCGYTCDVIDEAGVYNGVAYDKRQKKIRYNHVSVVAKGRAGPDVSIKMDSQNEVRSSKLFDSEKKSCDKKNTQLPFQYNQHMENKIMTLKIKIDSVEYEVSEDLAPVFQSKIDELKKAKSENAALVGKCDALNSEIEKRDVKIKDLTEKEMDENQLLQKADSLLKAKEFAASVLIGEKVDGVSIDDLKKSTVKKLIPNVDLEKKDALYIEASFETLMMTHKVEKKDDLKNSVEKSETSNDASTWQQKRDASLQEAIKNSRK